MALEEDNIRGLTAWAELDIKFGRFEKAELKLQQAERIAIRRNESTDAIETTRIQLDMQRGSMGDEKITNSIHKLKRLRESPDPETRVVAYSLLVKLLWMIGNRQMAENIFLSIFEDKPTPRAINNFAALLTDAKLFSEADSWYKESLALDQKNTHTLHDYGLNLIKWANADGDADRRKQGEQILNKAEALD